jgi:hypothetical protein
VAFFTIVRRADNDEVRIVSSLLRDFGVEVNDVQRFTSLTLPIGWASIALGVVARVAIASSIETKPHF